MADKSKVLVIGATGHLGKFIIGASVKAGHPTYALVRNDTLSNDAKPSIFNNFKKLGVTLVSGDVNDHESLVKAIKQVDVVISTLGSYMAFDQLKIIDAIKEAGNVKRFFPSEFGVDVDRKTSTVEPFKSVIVEPKIKIRRAVEAAGIPHTYVSANFLHGHLLTSLFQLGATSLPRDKVVMLGDGNVKAVFNNEEDVATYTIKAADDPRTLNKILYIRPPSNMISFNEIVSLWEKKIGKTLEKEYMLEEEILSNLKDCSTSASAFYSLAHTMFVEGDGNFDIDPLIGMEATALYPDVKYTTIDKFLDQLV